MSRRTSSRHNINPINGSSTRTRANESISTTTKSVPERHLRSSLLSGNGLNNGKLSFSYDGLSKDALAGKSQTPNIDKSLLTTLKDDSDKKIYDEYMFNFDKRLFRENDSILKCLNEFEIQVTNVDEESQTNLFKYGEYSLNLLNGVNELFEADNERQKDQEESNRRLLEEKKDLEINKIKESSQTITTRKGSKIMKPHRISLRKNSNKTTNSSLSSTLLKDFDNQNDPLADSTYLRFHKSKVRTEKGFAMFDKTKFLDDIFELNENFLKLIQLLNADSKLLMHSYVHEIFNYKSKKSLQAAEYTGTSSFISIFINYYHFKLYNGDTPKYKNLINLLDNFYNKNADSSIPGKPDNELTEKNQYNSLRYLLQKNPKYREDFKNLLLNDKGYKEQLESLSMRNNSTLNFQIDNYNLNQSEKDKIKGKSKEVYNNYGNFENLLINKNSVANTDTSEMQINKNLCPDRLLDEIDLNLKIYPLNFTNKDKIIFKVLRRLTFVDPDIMTALENLVLENNSTDIEGPIYEQNIKRFEIFHKCINYLSTITLLTLHETFKLLKFFKSYWNNKNEYLAFVRSREHNKINKFRHPQPHQQIFKSFKKKKKNNNHLFVNKFEKFEYLDICVSDPESESDFENDTDYYSDPENVPVEQLKEKRKRQTEKKFLNYYDIINNYIPDYEDDDDEMLHHNISPNFRKFVFNTSEYTKVVFDPRFGIKFFNTEELKKFTKKSVTPKLLTPKNSFNSLNSFSKKSDDEPVKSFFKYESEKCQHYLSFEDDIYSKENLKNLFAFGQPIPKMRNKEFKLSTGYFNDVKM